VIVVAARAIPPLPRAGTNGSSPFEVLSAHQSEPKPIGILKNLKKFML
jgi:hypothetical protein